jgi:membrane protease YdiL (CAAX protease family)
LLLPLSVLGFSYGCVWLTGIAVFIVPDQIGSVFSFVLDLVLSVAIIALTAAFGEEIGWRGYLLPHLMGLGFRRALLLSGLLHGLWHLPILIWTPFYHVMGNRFIIIPLFLLTLTVAGVCYGGTCGSLLQAYGHQLLRIALSTAFGRGLTPLLSLNHPSH